jgi:OHCU decarboxylase
VDTELDRLNSLSPADAQAEFLKCCGAARWARMLTEARPFADVPSLLSKADEFWWLLTEADWLEAFRAHPKIGERKAATIQSAQAQNWSAEEQSAVTTAADHTIAELALKNREYEERFGFIFIVCATGKSSEEMLDLLTTRLRNVPETELNIAATEQSRITRLRLHKLLTDQ